MNKNDDLLFEVLSEAAENVYFFENDMRYNYSNWSKNAEEYFDLPEDYHKNILNVWVDKIYPDDRQAYLEDVEAVFGGKKTKHRIQYRVKNRYGDYIWVECNGNVIRDENNQLKLFAGIITRLDNQTKYDPLTKKLTLHQFYINEEIGDASTVLLFGMDGFRRVLHSYGYEAGNEMLIALADELDKPALKQRVYRMNGDEFLVVLPTSSKRAAKEYFHETMNGFHERCLQMNYAKTITFSGAGEKFIPGKFDKEMLMKRLEHSMEQAKSFGGGQLVFFSEEIEEKHRRAHEISKALECAIAQDFKGFEVYYQPIMTVKNQKIHTVEALLRFHCEELGWIPPVEFIPILEGNRDIRKVGQWVMEQVVMQNKKWNEVYGNIRTGFNVSYLQLYNDSLIHHLIQIVEENHVDPKSIIVELTESCKVLYPESLSAMFSRIIDYGFLVALDDFGMENSTLTILRDIPITTVKIDHTFVRTITGEKTKQNEANLAIVNGIIAMCKKLSYNVVVEGIESKEVAEMMRNLGAEYLQGYFFSKPVPAVEVERFFD